MKPYLVNVLLVASILQAATTLPVSSSHALPSNPEHLIWDAWPASSDRHQHDHKPKKITPKSIFITPNFNQEPAYNCPPDHKLDNNGRCIQIVKINHDELLAHRIEALLSQTTNNQDGQDYDYDYGMDSGPFQLNLPLTYQPYVEQALPLTGVQDFQNSFRPSGENNKDEGKHSYFSAKKGAQDAGQPTQTGSGTVSTANSGSGSNRDGSNGTPPKTIEPTPPSSTIETSSSTTSIAFIKESGYSEFTTRDATTDPETFASTSDPIETEFGTFTSSTNPGNESSDSDSESSSSSITTIQDKDISQPSTYSSTDHSNESSTGVSKNPTSGTDSTEFMDDSTTTSVSSGAINPELFNANISTQSSTTTVSETSSNVAINTNEEIDSSNSDYWEEHEDEQTENTKPDYIGDDSRVIYEMVNSTIEEPHFTGNQTELLLLEQAIDMTNNTGEMEFINEDDSYEDIGSDTEREALFFGTKTTTTTPFSTEAAITTESTTSIPYYDRISTETSVVTATASEGPVFIVTPEPTRIWHPSLFSSPGRDQTKQKYESSTELPLIPPYSSLATSEAPLISPEPSYSSSESSLTPFEVSSEPPETSSPRSDRIFIRQPSYPNPIIPQQYTTHNQDAVLKHERTQDYLENLDSSNRFIYHHLPTQRPDYATTTTAPSTTSYSILEQIREINRIEAENRLRHPNYPTRTPVQPPTRFRFPSQQSYESPVIFPGATSFSRFTSSYPWQQRQSVPTVPTSTTTERPLWWLPNIRFSTGGTSPAGSISGSQSSQLQQLWERMPLVRDPAMVRERSNSRSTRRENSRSPSENLYRDFSTHDVYKVLRSAERDWKHTNS